MGKTLSYILEQCNMDSSQLSQLSSSAVKSNLKYKEATEDNKWRVELALELGKVRDGEVEVEGFTSEEIDVMLAHVHNLSWASIGGSFSSWDSLFFSPTQPQNKFSEI